MSFSMMLMKVIFKLKKTGVLFGTTCTCNPAASIVVCRVVPDQPLLLQPPPLRQYEHKLKTTFSLTPQTDCRRKKWYFWGVCTTIKGAGAH